MCEHTRTHSHALLTLQGVDDGMGDPDMGGFDYAALEAEMSKEGGDGKGEKRGGAGSNDDGSDDESGGEEEESEEGEGSEGDAEGSSGSESLQGVEEDRGEGAGEIVAGQG